MQARRARRSPHEPLDDARELLALGRASEAFALVDAQIRVNPNDAAAWALVTTALSALGETEYAALACVRAVQLAPDCADRRVELGELQEALNRPQEAAAAYEAALTLAPSRGARVAAHVALSGLQGRAGQFATARSHAESALTLDPRHQGALQNLAAICDHLGEVAQADAFRDRAYRGRALIVERAGNPRRRVLTLASAGRANSPDRMLTPVARYDRLIWFPAYADGVPREPYDVVFNAVADADAAAALESKIAAFAAQTHAPILNPPARIARTARAAAPALFAGVGGLIVPTVRRIETQGDFDGLADGEWLLRPAGTHGGEGLARISLAQATQRWDGRPHYLTAYRDFRSGDGLFRKYRMFFVDRTPFPYHLAIHDDWLVHYQTSLTPGAPALRDEERRFLENPRTALGDLAYEAIVDVGRRLDLDFAGVDFAVLPDGRALLFEANATMCLHDEPEDSPLAFKNPFVRRIQEAFWARLER
jgi:tetratricopeptide (TPR) repeat protein